MIALFAGQQIWGSFTRVVFSGANRRWQEEQVPGLGGSRIYDLGPGTPSWMVTGRIVAVGVSYQAALDAAVEAVLLGASYSNSSLYTFRDAAGNEFENCLLASFTQSSEHQACDYAGSPASTVKVSGQVRWMFPE